MNKGELIKAIAEKEYSAIVLHAKYAMGVSPILTESLIKL